MRSGIVAAFGATVALLACHDSVSPPANELLAAPVSVAIDDQQITLTSYLWRDFMPSSPPDGKPLVAIFRLVAANNGAISTTLRIDAGWVVFGDQVWSATITEERPASALQSYYEAVARNGPKWGPGVNVDVIVRIRGADDASWLLRASNQPIGRTD